MASYIQGYDEDRFVTSVNRNFICRICFNVIRDPVMCSRNQHCFCRSCITKHLKNAKRCPTCNDQLTKRTLTEAPRMIQDMLNELKIRCVYTFRGCQETPELQYLEKHEDTCGFTPAVCTNQGCGTTVNKRDLIHHESEVCEFRKLKCHSCGEMSKTLTTVEKRMANFEKYMATSSGKMETMVTIEKELKNSQTNMEKGIANVGPRMKNMQTRLINMERKITNIETRMTNLERNANNTVDKLNSVDKDVKVLKIALIIIIIIIIITFI